MTLSSDLIKTASQLAHVHQRRPRQVDLPRSISTTSYALLHGLAELAAWSRVYRDLSHLTAKTLQPA